MIVGMYSPDEGHSLVFKSKPLLSFDETKDFNLQKKLLKKKLAEVLGGMPKKVALNPVNEYKRVYDKHIEYRICFNTEQNVKAICLLCIPKMHRKKYPLIICMQGHGTGMHISMGREKYMGDQPDDGDRDIAIQAINRGYAALCLEQRGMGERRTEIGASTTDNGTARCHVTAMNALLVGRTIIGERCWDVSRAIDLALTYSEIDKNHIACTGNSAGGTTAYYAACLDRRIKIVMPSCAFCTFKDSIGAMIHCQCNYIPGIAKYMDMGDMAMAIVPRKLIVINGRDDPIFPAVGVNEAFDTVRKIYCKAGVPKNCILTTGNGSHRYYKREAWDAFDKITGGKW